MITLQRETFGDFIWRLLAQIMPICTIAFLFVVCLITRIGNHEIASLERELGVTDEILVVPERISVEEAFDRYIDTLPIPERTIERFVSIHEEEILMARENVAIQNADEKIATKMEVKAEVQAVDTSDEMLLAQIMHLEEGITRVYVSPEEARMAHLLCGSVIIHRRNMHYMGANSIRDVIYAPGQYSSIGKLYTEPIPEETMQWARELLQNGPIGPADMIFQSQSEQGGGTYAHIYNQYFCCLTDLNVTTEDNMEVVVAEVQLP